MKNTTILFFLLWILFKGYSQDYLIDFVASGASETLDSVKVENLTQNKSLIIPGTYTLRLLHELSGIQVSNVSEYSPNIYPNPAKEYFIIDFTLLKGGEINLAICDLTGKQIAYAGKNLVSGKHSYRVTGLDNGVYVVMLSTGSSISTGKIICQSGISRNILMSYGGEAEQPKSEETDNLKNTQTETSMEYTTGDLLKFTGYSADFSTIVTDIPSMSKTFSFTLMPCVDGDNNHYPAVTIGTQTWMAENLKTTQFLNHTPIPTEKDMYAWNMLSTPAYCYYENDSISYASIYGPLYNWYVIKAGNLCPTGWHVPSDAEWTTLVDYLGGTTIAGGKLKDTGTSLWDQPNTDATNESGFSALPGASRFANGTFYGIRDIANWWSSSEFGANDAWHRAVPYFNGVVFREEYHKTEGYSVRCIKN